MKIVYILFIIFILFSCKGKGMLNVLKQINKNYKQTTAVKVIVRQIHETNSTEEIAEDESCDISEVSTRQINSTVSNSKINTPNKNFNFNIEIPKLNIEIPKLKNFEMKNQGYTLQEVQKEYSRERSINAMNQLHKTLHLNGIQNKLNVLDTL